MQVGSPSFHGRIVVIGDASVGKTSILNRLVDSPFDDQERATIGANYQLWVEQIGETKIELQIWDTAGQEKFRSLGPIYFRNAIGAIVVYDVTNRQSFEDLEEWVTAFSEVAEPGALIAIVGNKSDSDDHVVTPKEAQEWASVQGMEWFQTSAKTGDGVKAMFHKFANELIARSSTRNALPSRDLTASDSVCSC
jgi:small GTP-binding protein